MRIITVSGCVVWFCMLDENRHYSIRYDLALEEIDKFFLHKQQIDCRFLTAC